MLLASSNTSFKLGVRPRAVTTPVRVRSPTGTCDETITQENLYPNLRPARNQTAQCTARDRDFSTVHIPRLCESRRTNLPDVTKQVPHFAPSKIRGRGRARLGLGLGNGPPFLIQGLAAPASSTTGTGTKGDQSLHQQHQRAPPRSRVEEERTGQPPPLPPPPPRPSDAPPQRFPPAPRTESPLAHARRGAQRAPRSARDVARAVQALDRASVPGRRAARFRDDHRLCAPWRASGGSRGCLASGA